MSQLAEGHVKPGHHNSLMSTQQNREQAQTRPSLSTTIVEMQIGVLGESGVTLLTQMCEGSTALSLNALSNVKKVNLWVPATMEI